MYHELKSQVAQHGWSVLRRSSGEPTLVLKQLVSAFGVPVLVRGQLTERFTPRLPEAARPSSLSAQFGLGEFPLHSDTAHWTLPARWVALYCEVSGGLGTPTRLLDTKRLALTPPEVQLAQSAAVLVRNGRRSFYGYILDRLRPFVRFDPGCLSPIDDYGRAALRLFQLAPTDERVENYTLLEGEVLLIDNWRMLHGRAAIRDGEQARTLIRALAR